MPISRCGAIYVGKLKASEPQRVWHVKCQLGEDLPVKFGLGVSLDEALRQNLAEGDVVPCGFGLRQEQRSQEAAVLLARRGRTSVGITGGGERGRHKLVHDTHEA